MKDNKIIKFNYYIKMMWVRRQLNDDENENDGGDEMKRQKLSKTLKTFH